MAQSMVCCGPNLELTSTVSCSGGHDVNDSALRSGHEPKFQPRSRFRSRQRATLALDTPQQRPYSRPARSPLTEVSHTREENFMCWVDSAWIPRNSHALSRRGFLGAGLTAGLAATSVDVGRSLFFPGVAEGA